MGGKGTAGATCKRGVCAAQEGVQLVRMLDASGPAGGVGVQGIRIQLIILHQGISCPSSWMRMLLRWVLIPLQWVLVLLMGMPVVRQWVPSLRVCLA